MTTETQKTALVTGATDGIGRETARVLAGLGYRVLVHGRTLEKASRACEELGAGVPVAADLSDLAAVRGLAEAVRGETSRLDVLVNNAGVFVHEHALTGDGIELTMAVNHFAPLVLTHELVPLLEATPGARVVHVSSVAHQRGRIDLSNVDLSKDIQNFEGYAAYATSKLANVLFSNAMARRPRATHNALHPGVIGTKLLKTGFGASGASVAEGARTSVKVATDPELAAATGRYFAAEREARASAAAADPELAERLYELSTLRAGVRALPPTRGS